jgi:hypothetical protein
MRHRKSFMQRIDDYLAVRRQAGFALKAEGEQLRHFARFAQQIGHRGPLTRSYGPLPNTAGSSIPKQRFHPERSLERHIVGWFRMSLATTRSSS